MSTAATEELTELQKLKIDAVLREETIADLRRALEAFHEYDGDEDLWGELMKRLKAEQADAARWRKVMDLAAYGGTWGKNGEHVWRFRPIMGPHQNLLDAVDNLGINGG